MTSDTRLRLAKYGSTRMQLIVALLFGNLMVTACSSNPRVKLPPLDPRKAGKLAISLHDANGDGGISDDELKSCPGLLASMDTVDSDGDHRLTAEEITDRLEKQPCYVLLFFPFMACHPTVESSWFPTSAAPSLPAGRARRYDRGDNPRSRWR